MHYTGRMVRGANSVTVEDVARRYFGGWQLAAALRGLRNQGEREQFLAHLKASCAGGTCRQGETWWMFSTEAKGVSVRAEHPGTGASSALHGWASLMDVLRARQAAAPAAAAAVIEAARNCREHEATAPAWSPQQTQADMRAWRDGPGVAHRDRAVELARALREAEDAFWTVAPPAQEGLW